MRRVVIIPMALLAVAGLALASCGSRAPTLSISMSEYEFSPPSWEVPAGAQVELTLINDGTLFHNWVLMPPEDEVEPPYTRDKWQQSLAEFRVRGGESETFTFTAPSEPGEYPVLCTEGGHFDLGMTGMLIVE